MLRLASDCERLSLSRVALLGPWTRALGLLGQVLPGRDPEAPPHGRDRVLGVHPHLLSMHIVRSALAPLVSYRISHGRIRDLS